MKINVFISIDNKDIYVGDLYVRKGSGKNIYSFMYASSYLNNKDKIEIDRELPLYEGMQYSSFDDGFRFISDSLPDRFGRHLIDINEKESAIKEKRNINKLDEVDYLLNTSDYLRMGAIRYSLDNGVTFLNKNNKVPKLINLSTLENYIFLLEDENNDEAIKTLHNLLSPISSLGGSRPKAVIIDKEDLYIAKFAKKDDDYDVSLWEYIIYSLAKLSKINISNSYIKKYSKYGHIFISKRFDRDKNKRIYYSSMMTLLGAKDGDNLFTYTDIAELINLKSSNPKNDLKEMYKRIVFTLRVNNVDDHLRNIGMILINNEFVLSPMFDVNSYPYKKEFVTLKERNRKSLINLSKYFRLSNLDANKIIDDINNVVSSSWLKLAKENNAKESEIKMFAKFLDINI